MMDTTERNQTVDILRGLAMLMVILEHTMTGCTTGSEDSFLFNVIWSLQIPLFILISGFVTRYSRTIGTGKELWKYVKKRTASYILPWIVWTFLVKGIVFQQPNYLDLKSIAFHMDIGYWFLITIWTISMVFGISQYLSAKLASTEARRFLLMTSIYAIGGILLLAVGIVFGMSFLAVKLTLYYMPFYYAGYIFGRYREKMLKWKRGRAVMDIAVAISTCVYFFILARYKLFALSENSGGIIIRVLGSLSGCICVCAAVQGVCRNNVGAKTLQAASIFRRAGIYSLELYLLHGFFLSPLKYEQLPTFSEPMGILNVVGNYLLTMLMTSLAVLLIDQNSIIRQICFGKKEICSERSAS